MIRRSLQALLAAAALLLLPAAAWARPPMWVAHGSGATIVLFGSVHVLPRGADWEPEALKQALAEADELWFETPIDEAAALDIAREALAKGMLPEGQSLSAKLSAKGRARLKREAEALHLPAAQLDRLRPWYAEVAIGEAAYAKEGVTADQGVERQLAGAAPQAARRAFETGAQQIDLFAGQSEPVQVASLEDTLRDLEEDPGQSKRLIDAWLKGDIKGLEKEGLEEMRRDSPQMFDVVLTRRNAAWLSTLSTRLRAPSAGGRPAKVVVVVGVGHLVGPGGVPALLRAKGFRVDGPRE
ncbi:MAG: TraB/GumN family protein [Caulobacteraceae bacterium]